MPGAHGPELPLSQLSKRRAAFADHALHLGTNGRKADAFGFYEQLTPDDMPFQHGTGTDGQLSSHVRRHRNLVLACDSGSTCHALWRVMRGLWARKSRSEAAGRSARDLLRSVIDGQAKERALVAERRRSLEAERADLDQRIQPWCEAFEAGGNLAELGVDRLRGAPGPRAAVDRGDRAKIALRRGPSAGNGVSETLRADSRGGVAAVASECIFRRMPRMQVYLPDDLYRLVKKGRLPASELLQDAVRAEVRRRALLEETEKYLAELAAEVGQPGTRQRSRAKAIVAQVAQRRRKAS